MWLLGIRTHVLTLKEQALLPRELTPPTLAFWAENWLFFFHFEKTALAV